MFYRIGQIKRVLMLKIALRKMRVTNMQRRGLERKERRVGGKQWQVVVRTQFPLALSSLPPFFNIRSSTSFSQNNRTSFHKFLRTIIYIIFRPTSSLFSGCPWWGSWLGLAFLSSFCSLPSFFASCFWPWFCWFWGVWFWALLEILSFYQKFQSTIILLIKILINFYQNFCFSEN